jgi:hypothetical protein
MVFIAFGAVAGSVLAFRRYPVFLLVPLVGFLAASALLVGIVEGSHAGAIGVEVLGSLAAPQLVYLAVSQTDDLPRSARLLPQVQTAIGQQLRAQLEVLRSLPLEIAVRVRQLRHANHIRNVEVL